MSDYRILITGSRTWSDRAVIHDALHKAADTAETSGRLDPSFDRIVVVHGGAAGADSIAGDIARQWGLPVEVHRADWKTYGAAAGPRRNKIMVGLGADICLAFPVGDSRGTRHCMAAAARAGIPVIDHDPALREAT